MMDSTVEVARYDRFSSDPDTFDGWMRDAYVGYRRLQRDEEPGSRFSLTGAEAPGFSVATVQHGSRFAVETEALDEAIVLVTTTAGRVAVSAGDVLLETASGGPYLMPPGRPWVVHGEALVTEVVRLERAVLDATAAGMGWDGGEIRFTDCLPRAEMASYLASTIEHVRRDVLDGFDALPSLIAIEAARSLAAAVLVTIPNTAADDLADRVSAVPGRDQPATVRRAVAFMDANAQHDIHIGQIAEAARIGARGLQAAFRRHRDQTPLEYLRTIRMDHAHRDLLAGDPTRGDTVADIAARWGFTHPGRFSVDYRRSFGSSPSSTLRN